jgi:hypothetical protein
LDLVTLGITTVNPSDIEEISYKRLMNRYDIDPFFGLDPTLVGSDVAFPLFKAQTDRKSLFIVNVANLGTKSNDVEPVPAIAYYGFCGDVENPLGPFIPAAPTEDDYAESFEAALEPGVIVPYGVGRAAFRLDLTSERAEEAILYATEQLGLVVNPDDAVLPICIMPNYSVGINSGGINSDLSVENLNAFAEDADPANNPLQIFIKIIRQYEPPCESGETRTCGQNIGVCTPGIQTCVNSIWGSCVGAILPMPVEICTNRLDDDCDGRTDEQPCIEFCPDCIGPGPTPPETEILGNCIPSGTGLTCDFWMSPISPAFPNHHMDENPSDSVAGNRIISDPVLGTSLSMLPITIGDSLTELPMVQTTFEFYLNGELERRYTNNPRGVATFVPFSAGAEYVVVAYRPDDGSRRIGYFVAQTSDAFDPFCDWFGLCDLQCIIPGSCDLSPPTCDGTECTVACPKDEFGINCPVGCDQSSPDCPSCIGSGCDTIETCSGAGCSFAEPGPFECYGNSCPDCQTQDCSNVIVNGQDTTCFGNECPLDCDGGDCRFITTYCNATVNTEGKQVTENTYPVDITRVCQVFCKGVNCPEVPKYPPVVRGRVDNQGIHITATYKNGEPIPGVKVTPGLLGNYYAAGYTDELGEYAIIPPLSGIWEFNLVGDEFSESVEVPWTNYLASIISILAGPLTLIFGASALETPELLVLLITLSFGSAYLAFVGSKMLLNKGMMK